MKARSKSIQYRPIIRLSQSLSVLAIALGLISCEPVDPSQTSSESEATRDLLTVVTTSTMITDWATQIGGDEFAIIGILEPGADPHVYEPVPADTVAIEDADLIFYNGYDLEPSLIRMVEATGENAMTVALAEVAVTPLDSDYEGETVPDPHVWGNVENVILMVDVMQEALIELSPENEDTITDNGDRYLAELETLHQWIQEQISTIPAAQRRLITTHDAFAYYADAYGLDVTGTLIGISTEEQPSAQTVQQLVEAVRAAGVPSIFAETTINSRLIATVAEEADVQLAAQELYSDSLGTPNSNAATYIDMMIANTTAIVENLGGELTPYPGDASMSEEEE